MTALSENNPFIGRKGLYALGAASMLIGFAMPMTSQLLFSGFGDEVNIHARAYGFYSHLSEAGHAGAVVSMLALLASHVFCAGVLFFRERFPRTCCVIQLACVTAALVVVARDLDRLRGVLFRPGLRLSPWAWSFWYAGGGLGLVASWPNRPRTDIEAF